MSRGYFCDICGRAYNNKQPMMIVDDYKKEPYRTPPRHYEVCPVCRDYIIDMLDAFAMSSSGLIGDE